ncbi:energy transducer TonB [Sulfurospirillum arsenophilum]|uniref:energy transducer TonB n=1 Tax=Sulfurospirillum arsenophilum TaxID=56698 RepID=UPI0005A996D4|nr:energy transducer TonB [Sulfurospirillum arsenophilum]
MKTSHLAFAILGSVSLHVMIAYALFMGNMAIPKPSLREFVVSNVMLLEEPLPNTLKEEIKKEVPVKPEPIVEKKSEKNVKKELVKAAVPIKESMSTSSSTTSESFAEQTIEMPSSVKAQEKVSVASSRQSDDLLSRYLAKVRHKIQESLHYPSMARKMGIEGEAVVQFLIHANGMVDASSIKIAKSSGKAVLDRNAVDAVLEAIPFELPPKEDLEIVIPVVFKLTS